MPRRHNGPRAHRGALTALAAVVAVIAGVEDARATLIPTFPFLETASRDNRILDPDSGRVLGTERTRAWREEGERWRFFAIRDYPGVRTILEENVARIDDRIHPLTHRYEVHDAAGKPLHAIRVDYDAPAGVALVRWDHGGEHEEKRLEMAEPPYMGHLMGLGLRAIPALGLSELRFRTIAVSPRIFDLEILASVKARAAKSLAGAPTLCVRIDPEPQLGFLLTTIAGLFSPRTELWYGAAPPHDFCGFHGLPLPWTGEDEVWVEPTEILGPIDGPEPELPRLDSEAWRAWRSGGADTNQKPADGDRP